MRAFELRVQFTALEEDFPVLKEKGGQLAPGWAPPDNRRTSALTPPLSRAEYEISRTAALCGSSSGDAFGVHLLGSGEYLPRLIAVPEVVCNRHLGNSLTRNSSIHLIPVSSEG